MTLKIDENLQLELVKLSDAQDIFEVVDSQREYLGAWLPFVPFIKEIADEENFIKSNLETLEQTQDYIFCIRKNGKFIGLINLFGTDKANQKTEIGYWISQEFQKQGIVTKSVNRLCEFAFNELNINRIQIRCATENEPSKSIPKRLNFIFEGIERQGERASEGVFRYLEVYSKLKKDF